MPRFGFTLQISKKPGDCLTEQFCVRVMYDATGVRLQAGRQAEVLNQIVYELPAEHPLAESRPFCELLGHTLLRSVLVH
ncbi:hypothetical protein LguiB_016303 [Lonicera macranthoides]